MFAEEGVRMVVKPLSVRIYIITARSGKWVIRVYGVLDTRCEEAVEGAT